MTVVALPVLSSSFPLCTNVQRQFILMCHLHHGLLLDELGPLDPLKKLAWHHLAYAPWISFLLDMPLLDLRSPQNAGWISTVSVYI
jgi:hypothetical protein